MYLAATKIGNTKIQMYLAATKIGNTKIQMYLATTKIGNTKIQMYLAATKIGNTKVINSIGHVLYYILNFIVRGNESQWSHLAWR